MKKSIYGILFLALLGTIMFGCEKVESTSPPKIQNNIINKQKSAYKTSNYSLNTSFSVSNVGQYHNFYLLQAVNYAVNNSTLNYSLILDELDYDLDEFTQDNINEALINSTESERMTFLEIHVLEDVYNILISLEGVINNYPGDYNDVNTNLDQVLSNVNFNQFDQFNSYLITGYAETLRSSAYFWYPTSTGGSAAGDAYRVYRGKDINNVQGLPGWAKADGRSFGWGLVWGTIFSGNPGSGAAAGIISGVGGSLMYGR
mgnify:CR=1 FL=1